MSVLALTTLIFHLLTLVQLNNIIYFCLILDVMTELFQKCLLSCHLPSNIYFVQFLILIYYHGNWKAKMLYTLAHLSQRLTRWAYSIPMVRPSVVVVRRCPHFQTWISLKPGGQSWSNLMCSITWVGERLHKVLGQIGSKLWFPWQQKAAIDL